MEALASSGRRTVEEGRMSGIFNLLRLMSKVDENGCWIWEGQYNSGRRPIAFWKRENRKISDLWLDHNGKEEANILLSCQNHSCVNPDHMEIHTGTSARQYVSGAIKEQIVKLYRQGGWSQHGLATKFSLHVNTVAKILKGK